MNPETVGNGSYLSLATELNSFDDILKSYKTNGKEYSFNQVPGELFSTFFEGAREIAQMLGYFESYTYMGPDSDPQIQMAKNISTEPFTSLNDWMKQNVQ